MWLPWVMDIRYPILCMLIAADISLGLRDIRVTIPTSVKKGDDVHLKCNYDLEGDTLYSIKWYKGRHEFYRYTPKENPAMKTFPVFGINVERDYSNASHVYLKSVEVNISGKFSCEVSADAPSFHTMLVSGDMEIVEIPNHKPSIIGLQSRYRPGDVLRGNCSSYYSKPAANLTWTINGVPASPSELMFYKIDKNDRHLEQSNLGLRILVTQAHFLKNKLKLECKAQIHDIYSQTTEKYVEEDRPRILATGTSNSHNSLNVFQSSVFDGDGNEQNEAYLKNPKADIPSSSSTTSGILMHSYLTICWITFYICTICTILLYSLRVGIS